jgi:transposase
VDQKPTRKSYTADFRRQAVALVFAENLPLAEVARRLGVNPEVLRKWKTKYAPATPPADRPDPSLADEVRRLKEQVRQLTMEREILKKAATFFAKEAT